MIPVGRVGSAAMALSALGIGCLPLPVGTTAGGFMPARGPAGVRAEVETSSAMWTGEVLAVADSGVWIVAETGPGRHVVFAPTAALQRARFAQVGTVTFTDGVPNAPRKLDRARLVSRYPQGIGPELLGRLLAAYGPPQGPIIAR